MKSGNFAAAEQACRQQMQSDPVAATESLVRIYLASKNYDRARMFFPRLLELIKDPKELAEYWYLYGELHVALGDETAAVSAFEKSLELGFDDVKIFLQLGVRRAQAGDFSSAKEFMERFRDSLGKQSSSELSGVALALDEGIFLAGRLFKGDDARPWLDIVENMLDRRAKKVLEPCVAYNFGLGMLHEQLGHYSDALLSFRKANELKYGAIAYDAEDMHTRIHRLIETFDSAHFSKHLEPSASTPGTSPIFIVGVPRSGTSLVEQILGQHSAVQPMGEITALGDALKKVKGSGASAGWDLEHPETLDGQFYEAIVEDYRGRIELDPAVPFHTNKLPSNLLYLWLAARAFPQAKIVHCQREKFPTVMSCFATHFRGVQPFSGDVKDCADFYDDCINLMSHWRPFLEDRLITVHYEELVQNATDQIDRLLDFLGLEREPDCYEPHKSDRVVETASIMHVQEPIYVTGNRRWEPYRKFLSDGEASCF